MTDIVESPGAYRLECRMNQEDRLYAGCLNVLRGSDNGHIKPRNEKGDCFWAIQHGNCTAYEMREEERKAGKRLYKVERPLGSTLDHPMRPEAEQRRSWRGNRGSVKHKNEDKKVKEIKQSKSLYNKEDIQKLRQRIDAIRDTNPKLAALLTERLSVKEQSVKN